MNTTETPEAPPTTEQRGHPDWVEAQKEEIARGQREPASLGVITDTDVGDGTYQIEYESEFTRILYDDEDREQGTEADVRFEEVQFPRPSDDHIEAPYRPWCTPYTLLPHISWWEALLRRHRYGKVQRQILRLLSEASGGKRVITGHSLAVAIETAYCTLAETVPDLSNENRLRTVANAARQLARAGLIEVFLSDNPHGYEDAYLLQHTPALRAGISDLIEKYRGDFGLPEALTEQEPFEMPPLVLAGAKDATEMFRRASAHGRSTATVDDADKGYPDQPYHFVIRNSFAGKAMAMSSAARVLVSEIKAVSSLADYGKTTSEAMLAAVEEMRQKPTPKNAEDVRACLSMLTTDDQKACLHYVQDNLGDDAKVRIGDLSFEGTHGIELVLAAISEVPTRRKQRAHVLRQVRLLVADIVTDLIALWNHKVVSAFDPLVQED
ncbi:hypothetical protein CMI48_04305 [Candidatus Pacearchaeota archaeon]|jgi:hypothetical protein|nr:hypothetical protein [Candidatus Pacearchaeota archaeon]|tara:strand:- start:660 stop:1976 length:1317 start_codon:yes stop_codon:yes gene_type:complete